MPTFFIQLLAYPDLNLFEDDECVTIFQRNLRFVASKFGLTIRNPTSTREAFSCTIEGPDQSTVAKALERLQRFTEREILRECESIARTMTQVDDKHSSIWAKPASCRRVRGAG